MTKHLLLALALAPMAAAQWTPAERGALLQRMDSRAAHFGDISKQIWDLAEVGYQEERSAALLRDELKKAGFTIAERVADIPTAFTARWGSGHPVIGILGEYDALPGLEQEAVPVKKPLRATKPGHGCGHNLFGSASAFAAISVKDQLMATKQSGTIRFYGCPAEEGGGGKIYMVRAGAFKDCDVVLHWHPDTDNSASLKNRIMGRAQSLARQFGQPPPQPLRFESGGARLKDWRKEPGSGSGPMDAVAHPEGKKTLWIKNSGEGGASWRLRLPLAAGSYRLEGVAKVKDVGPAVPEGKGQGAGLRISGATAPRPNQLTGSSGWEKLAYEFEVASGPLDVDLVCELRGGKGEVWFDAESLRLVRVK